MQLPSDLGFCSFLQYSPRGVATPSVQSKRIRDAIKNDGFLCVSHQGKSEMVSGIEFVVRRLADEVNQYPFLRECFGPDVILVPVPRSAPLRQKDALWPTLKICTAMYKAGLGGEVAPILIRRTAVQKSATAGHGERPNPQTHFASTAADGALPLLAKGKITIVDDFITRGSTFIGMYPHITGRYSGQRVFCFALIRTISSGEVESWKSPVQGRIIFNPSTDYLHREP